MELDDNEENNELTFTPMYLKLTNNQELIAYIAIDEDNEQILLHDPLLVVVLDEPTKYGLSKWITFSEDRIINISPQFILITASLSDRYSEIYESSREKFYGTTLFDVNLGKDNADDEVGAKWFKGFTGDIKKFH